MGPHGTEKLLKGKDLTQQDQSATYRLGKIFTNPTSDRGLMSKIYKELKKVDFREPSLPKKWGTELNRFLNRGILNG